jgi:hypothetical protein
VERRRQHAGLAVYDHAQHSRQRYAKACGPPCLGAGAFVWLDPEMDYAIAGDIPREPLMAISKIVYETFEPTH